MSACMSYSKLYYCLPPLPSVYSTPSPSFPFLPSLPSLLSSPPLSPPLLPSFSTQVLLADQAEALFDEAEELMSLAPQDSN